MQRRHALVAVIGLAACMAVAPPAAAQQATGTLEANGKTAALTHAIAVEVDSATEKGSLVHTPGKQSEFKQQWSYDVTFSAPIALDPAAKTVPKR